MVPTSLWLPVLLLDLFIPAFLFHFCPYDLWGFSALYYSAGVLDVKQETIVSVVLYLKHHHTLYLPCSGYCKL